MNWVLMQLGYPLVQVEITEAQLRMCINDAVEEFTKYVRNSNYFQEIAAVVQGNSFKTL
jgi:hypothetical protein